MKIMTAWVYLKRVIFCCMMCREPSSRRASTMGEDIKRVTGVDILEVDTQNDEENPESERIQVTVGKKLSRRMTVKYAVESKQGAFTRRVISEYKFIDELLMTGAQDSTGIFSGELVFRLEFR